jgi:hypothetical protein
VGAVCMEFGCACVVWMLGYHDVPFLS